MSLEGGVLFFEDGTEVSGISVEMIKALPDLLKASEELISRLDIVRLRGYVGHPLVDKVWRAVRTANGELNEQDAVSAVPSAHMGVCGGARQDEESPPENA